MRLALQEVGTPATVSAIYSCSTMLYAMTMRWPSAGRYRDAFEGVKDSISDLLYFGSHQPHQMTDNIPPPAANQVAIENLYNIFGGSGVVGLDQMYDSIIGEQGINPDWTEEEWNFSIDNLGATVPMMPPGGDRGMEVGRHENKSVEFSSGISSFDSESLRDGSDIRQEEIGGHMNRHNVTTLQQDFTAWSSENLFPLPS